MDNESFFAWGAGYAAAGKNDAWPATATASSAPAPGVISNNTAATTSSSRPDDDSKNNNTTNNSASSVFGSSNTSFSSSSAGFDGSNTSFSGSGFGGGNISFGDTSFNSNNDTTSGIRGSGANQLMKLTGDIGTMQISSSITTSYGPLTTDTASCSASVLPSAPSSAQDQTGSGGEVPSSSPSLGKTHDSEYYEQNSVITHQEKKAFLSIDHCMGKR